MVTRHLPHSQTQHYSIKHIIMSQEFKYHKGNNLATLVVSHN